MSTRTLLFENIPRGESVFNINTIGNTPGRPRNAYGASRVALQQLGRYGQTSGSPFGDRYPGTPICPYHMPRNLDRFNEPRLTLNKKNVGDVIQAKDINNLIDRIKLFEYVWEAEANNIYSYAGVSGTNRLAVSSIKLNKIINNTNGNHNNFTIVNPRIDGDPNSFVYVTIPKTPQFYSVDGLTEAEVEAKLINAMGSQIKTGTEFNNPCKHGFPEYLDDVFLPNSTDTVDKKYSILNGGFASLQGVKFIQESQNDQKYFNLLYTSGNNKDTFVTGTNGIKLRFKYNEPYIISYREDNQPTTKEKFIGFILYFLSVNIDNTTRIKTETVITYTDPIESIKNYAKTISGFTTGALTPINYTREINYNLKPTLTEVPSTSYLWSNVDSKLEFMAWFNTLTDTTITIPKQRVYGGAYEYWDGSNWIPIDGIFSITAITPHMKTYEEYITTTPPPPAPQVPVTTKYIRKVYGFTMDTAMHKPLETEVKVNWDINNDTFIYNPDNSIEFNQDFFTSGKTLMKLILSKDYFQHNGGLDFIIQPEDNLIGIYNESSTSMEYYNSNGASSNQITYRYNIGMDCPTGSVEENGSCKITNTITTSIIGSLVGETDDTYTIREDDITFRNNPYHLGTGKFPLIKPEDYTNIQSVLKKYLNNILNIASTGINNGSSDVITKNLINDFLNTEEAWGTAFDKNNPDTSFVGFRAQTGGLIKVEFYNILVEAYKLIINSCLCNADCACNVNCICNVNCGCNYSG